MKRAEFVTIFYGVWDDNSGYPHSAEQLEEVWDLVMTTLEEEGEKIDRRWRPTRQERAKWIVPRYLEEERYDD